MAHTHTELGRSGHLASFFYRKIPLSQSSRRKCNSKREKKAKECQESSKGLKKALDMQESLPTVQDYRNFFNRSMGVDVPGKVPPFSFLIPLFVRHEITPPPFPSCPLTPTSTNIHPDMNNETNRTETRRMSVQFQPKYIYIYMCYSIPIRRMMTTSFSTLASSLVKFDDMPVVVVMLPPMPPGSHSQGQGSRQGARVQGGRGSAAHHKIFLTRSQSYLTYLTYLAYPLLSCLVLSCLDLILSYLIHLPKSKKKTKKCGLSVCLALLSSLRASVSVSVSVSISTPCLPFPRKSLRTYCTVLYCTARASFPKRTKGKNSQAPLTFCLSVCVRGKGRKEGKGASKIDWHGNSLRFVPS